jgi:hypothetical protein
MTRAMFPVRLKSTPDCREMNSNFRALLKSRVLASDLSFWLFLGKGLPPGPSWSDWGVSSLSLRAVTMLRTVKAVRKIRSRAIGYTICV